MQDGFLRVAAITPAIRVADCAYNATQVLNEIEKLPSDTAVAVFPELCITGYTCGDLFLQPLLIECAEKAVATLIYETAFLDTVLVVGVPVAQHGALYNCAAVIQKGRLLGLVPKHHIPHYGDLQEKRYFAEGMHTPQTVSYAGHETVFGTDIVFACQEMPAFRLGVEVCEDLFAPIPRSCKLSEAGATVIAHLYAGCEAVGKHTYRSQLLSVQSARLHCGYISAGAGAGESTTDCVYAGRNVIAENGKVLCESGAFTTGAVITEIDTERLLFDRRKMAMKTDAAITTVSFSFPPRELQLTRQFSKTPFIPADEQDRLARAEEILSIQTAGLVQRLRHTNSCAVIGLSGGLDSALALLVIVRAYDQLGWPRQNIHTVTMPCFGTTGRTLGNARLLAAAVGSTLHEIDITASATQHLQDIGHDGKTPDVTFENAQARERTQVLMDLANRKGGLVIGTGDLSELALGWATFNGDHMSMYGVNGDVPKTLVRHLVAYEAQRLGEDIGAVLTDILDTPVSPELLPPQDGDIAQKTEQLVGPYILHDFFLYWFVRYGFPPHKIYRLATAAFADEFYPQEIKTWLENFVKRFFGQQFKRSCLPDGPKVGSVALSPRGDWKMPSDAVSTAWLQDME